jgi:hypothetical protein
MLLFEKIDMFLLGEAKEGIKLTPLASSMVKKLKGRTKEEIDAIVSEITPKVKDGKMYEISFDRTDKGDKIPLIIYRKGNDVIKRTITPEVHKEYRGTVETFLKGTGLKITGEVKSADWLAFKVE